MINGNDNIGETPRGQGIMRDATPYTGYLLPKKNCGAAYKLHSRFAKPFMDKHYEQSIYAKPFTYDNYPYYVIYGPLLCLMAESDPCRKFNKTHDLWDATLNWQE